MSDADMRFVRSYLLKDRNTKKAASNKYAVEITLNGSDWKDLSQCLFEDFDISCSINFNGKMYALVDTNKHKKLNNYILKVSNAFTSCTISKISTPVFENNLDMYDWDVDYYRNLCKKAGFVIFIPQLDGVASGDFGCFKKDSAKLLVLLKKIIKKLT